MTPAPRPRGQAPCTHTNPRGILVDPALASLLGTLVGGGVTYFLNKQLHAHQLAALRAQFRTDFMAEETARHFLGHKSYTDRSFETLGKHLGGFGDDELRKILVRAGAIRVYRDDGSEWWRLLSRMDEYIARHQHDDAADAG